MIKKNIKCFILIISFIVLMPGYSNASNLSDAFGFGDNILNQVSETAGYKADTSNNINVTISVIISAALSFLGVIFLILIIYAGYLWMMARGNEQQVEKAKSLLTEAVIGLIIVVSAYAISYFVIKKIGGSTLENQGAAVTNTAE